MNEFLFIWIPLIKLREKKSFTKKQHNEIASAGIYYFYNFDEFNDYSRKVMQLKNKYISN